MTPTFRELDTVVLTRDVPEASLRAGDLGAIVQIYGADAMEVEIVAASGRTQASLTLHPHDLRAVHDDDLLTVRPMRSARGAA